MATKRKVASKAEKKEKMAVTPKVAKLLRRVIDHILEEPTRYDQAQTLIYREPGESFCYTVVGRRKVPSCGTIGCLAGWVTALSKAKAKHVEPVSFAAEKLGLTQSQMYSLFGTFDAWPDEFADAYEAAKTPRQVAKVAAKRVEHFIKTGE